MAPAELVAAGFGFAYILLAIRQHRACWVAGAIGTAIYAKVFHDAGLPMQAGLQVVYVVLSIYGYVAWRKDQGRSAPVRRWTTSRNLLAVAAVGLATAVSAPLAAQHTPATAPLADSLGTWSSLVATWLLARRYVDNWLWWVVIDAGLAALFASRGLLATAALYGAYALLAVAGWRSWRRAAMPA